MHLRRASSLLAIAIFTALLPATRAAEPFLKKGDVIALIGGEDMVAASEYGYLELLLTRALPDYRLKFRNLAWEGDTVFEQPRQLNYPPLEKQLDDIGATVVICQFGQMESLAGKVMLPAFLAAYDKLLGRIGGGGKRKIILLAPFAFAQPMAFMPDDVQRYNQTSHLEKHNPTLNLYSSGISELAERKGWRFADVKQIGVDDVLIQRDGMHLTQSGHACMTHDFALTLGVTIDMRIGMREKAAPLYPLIIAKNRLRDDYRRPQNWAFLNGDRITQPSSRDHRDPSVRWFPAEMEQFLPLIAAKEEAIWKLAADII